MKERFQCDRCGLCCMHIRNSEIYSFLDRGDGVCRYYNELTKLCEIYENRPIICNIDQTYEKYFKDKMSRNEYYNLNYLSCKKLKNEG